MFISNIIYRLLVIIYKSGVICKGYNSPYKQGPTTTLSYYNCRFHRTHLHDLLTHSAYGNKHVPLFLFRLYELTSTYTCFTFLTHILTWVLESFVLQVAPPIKGTPQSRRVKFGTPLNYVNPDVSQFQILVRAFGAHCGDAIKHTPRPLVNPLSSIHS